jgi:AAA+ superfamily predicted ATPase
MLVDKIILFFRKILCQCCKKDSESNTIDDKNHVAKDVNINPEIMNPETVGVDNYFQIPELIYIENLIEYRLNIYFKGISTVAKPIFSIDNWYLPLKNFVIENNLSQHEATLLLIGLIPHIEPDFFEREIEIRLPKDNGCSKIGGFRSQNSRTFLPTGETALFLIAGNNWLDRRSAQTLFDADHFFSKQGIASLEELPLGEPIMSGRIILSQEYFEIFTTGKTSPPKFNSHFPAQLISSTFNWEDVVLNPETQLQITEILNWANYGNELLEKWNLKKFIKPGFRALFYGPPGTGKTMTASLIGNLTQRDVYKIDLSAMVSKYIGETEKNLSNLFSRAENKNWILFFDEADAIFGKRTGVKDAHDKYANQEVSYLLQRIESFSGIVILASNQKSNIDDAFVRRFNSIISFQMPSAIEREDIWKKLFPSHLIFEETIDFQNIANKYELAGGNISNVVHYACLKAFPLENKTNKVIKLEYIHEGIRKEYAKDGKMFKI